MIGENAAERTKRCVETYLPESEKFGAPVVHRSLVADAFAAGMRAVVTVEIPADEIALEFEAYCEEAFTE